MSRTRLLLPFCSGEGFFSNLGRFSSLAEESDRLLSGMYLGGSLGFSILFSCLELFGISFEGESGLGVLFLSIQFGREFTLELILESVWIWKGSLLDWNLQPLVY